MRALARTAATVVLLLHHVSASQWSLGYWSARSVCPITQLQWNGLTHIIHDAALVKPDGTLDFATQGVSDTARSLIETAHANGVRVLITVAQEYWRGDRISFQNAGSRHLASLADDIMQTVKTYGYDGVDLDWEPFDPESNGKVMSSLGEELRKRLGNKVLTATASVTDGAYWGKAHASFDRVNVMTYDLAGTWNPYSWHNSALYDSDGLVWSVNLAVNQFTAAGVPAGKLGIGLPFCGWEWTGITAPRQPWGQVKPSGVQMGYNALISRIKDETPAWDDAAKVPYVSLSGSYITYDDERSISAKIAFARERGLGGWIIWELGGDYIPGAGGAHPLLRAVANAMQLSNRHIRNPDPRSGAPLTGPGRAR